MLGESSHTKDLMQESRVGEVAVKSNEALILTLREEEGRGVSS